MKRSTVELEITPEIEDHVRVIAEGENCSIESILQEGLALLFGDRADWQCEYCQAQQTLSFPWWSIISSRFQRVARQSLKISVIPVSAATASS